MSSAYPDWIWQDAETVARVGYAAVEANRPRAVPGWNNRLLAAIPKLLPDDLALRIIGGHARRLDRL